MVIAKVKGNINIKTNSRKLKIVIAIVIGIENTLSLLLNHFLLFIIFEAIAISSSTSVKSHFLSSESPTLM